MKSRISIDVDYDNQPIIKVEYVESEDVRDKLVGRFLRAFNGLSGASVWATAYNYGHNPHTRSTELVITPIPTSDLTEQSKLLKIRGEDEDKEQEQASKEA